MNGPEFVELRGGLLVRADAIALGCDLEARGHTMTVASNGKLLVTNAVDLPESDIADIKRLRNHLIAAVGYEP